MRLLICAGGTGGGVYPALVVLRALSARIEPDVLWVGGEGGMEADLVKREGIPFESIPAAGVHGVGVGALPGNFRTLSRGYTAARRILNRFQPDVLFFTGGYVAVPAAVAARQPLPGKKRPRSLVYIPDLEPGLALKVILRFADLAALTAEETRQYLPSRKPAVVTGYPVRQELKKWSKEEGIKVFDLCGSHPILLVTGGSRGARTINQALFNVLPELLQEIQVIHITGTLDWPEVEKFIPALSPEQLSRYRAYPYLHEEMGAAMSAADLVLSRAGASILGEYPHFGLPAILVPYPHAWDYQYKNTRYLEGRGAALMIRDDELQTQILPVVRGLLQDSQRLEEMRKVMHSFARPDAPEAIARLLLSLAGQPAQES